ncbi:CsiV family protein [Rheinheimera salexigens]|uniref:Peptidoglycan-binding protein n=1 Tax=Rheinheimera salexigens TaxID=1628148 RepID=A0A1E7Q622_9GAMM|nr:CsiV family protein [Rheinheimera salexigens]OEY69518.1 hypothetical protein BI198_08065 [Rheinheimera salexigens]
MFKLATLGTICCLLLSAYAQAQEQDQRWFEVEVIIFSQTPATDIHEQFDKPVKPIRPGRSIDLVTPLYQPNITPILESLPLCSAPDALKYERTLQAQLHINPAHYYQFKTLCVFEPQTKPWLQRNVMQTRYVDNQLVMPKYIPAVITGRGEHVNQPYLVAADGLQLTDITTRLQRQADKKVLLHTAWRQVPVTQRRAIASHWYAGNNLSDKFDYWGQPKQSTALPLTNSPLVPGLVTTDSSIVLDANQTDIINNIEQLLAQLNANPQLPPTAVAVNDSNESQDSNGQFTERQLGLKVPDNTWQLDGLFKLHLDHYLFVNTEFNLRVPSADSLKTVYVKQSRRVISGEIHYLDHPYLGIILQIRRYDPNLNITDTLPE